LDLDKTGFPEVTDGDDPTRQAEDFSNRFHFLIGEGIEGFMKLSGGMRHPEIVRVRIDPVPSQGIQFFDPLLNQLTRFIHFFCSE
jgi:hypothetical protein